MRGGKLGASLATVISIVIALVLLAYVPWSVARHTNQVRERTLAEARTLNAEMESVWDYVNAQQDIINYDLDGSYHFRGVYCTVAAKGVAQRFMGKTDYVVRYVRENPRSGTDYPDEYEAQAIAAWRDAEVAETHSFTQYDGVTSLRYTSVILIKGNCLKCHGGPAGEKDETGYYKEGMSTGDLAGLASIVIPMASYESEVAGLVMQDVLLMLALVTAVGGAAWVAVHMWVVRPLRQVNEATRAIGSGDFSARIGLMGGRAEVRELVSEVEAMAEELSGMYASLESKVAERTADLAATNEELKRANAMLAQSNEYKSQFLATVSHELRTPLTSVIAFADVLAAPPTGDETTRELASQVAANARTLLSMINDLIDSAKIEAGRYTLEEAPVDVVDVFQAVERLVGPVASAKGVTFATSVDPDIPVVMTDPEALRRIVANLSGNAAKFTDEGSIEVLASMEGEETLVVSVSDTGIGIAPENLELIFEPFSRPDAAAARARAGSGLGLSLVREICRMLGGSVAVQSELGDGSTFTVHLPVRTMQEGDEE